MSGTSDKNVAMAEKNLVISSMLERKYGSWLGNRYFEVDCKSDSSIVAVTILLRDSEKSFYYPIEGRINFADQDMTSENSREFLLDFMDAYVEEFLSGGEETYLTIDWSTYDCDGVELQLRGQILNMKLEGLADELLRRPEVLN
jgi:hypothetical protein